MSMNLASVPHENPDGEQLSWIEGFPAAGHRFSLKSVANLFTDRQLQYEERVHFTGAGVVRGMHTVESKDGVLLAVFDIQVDDADLVG
jgi:hypothetical protein